MDAEIVAMSVMSFLPYFSNFYVICDFLSSRSFFSAILRARRSSCLRLSTALSTMPSTNCSADPPQKRSIMALHRAHGHVLARVRSLVNKCAALGLVGQEPFFFQPAQYGANGGVFHRAGGGQRLRGTLRRNTDHASRCNP